MLILSIHIICIPTFPTLWPVFMVPGYYSVHPSLIHLVFESDLYYFSTCTSVPQLASSDYLGLLVTIKHHYPILLVQCQWTCQFWETTTFMLKSKPCLIPLAFSLVGHALTTFLDINGAMYPQGCTITEEKLAQVNIQLISKRNLSFKKACHSGSRDDHLKFKQLRNKVVAKIKLANCRFFTDLHPCT